MTATHPLPLPGTKPGKRRRQNVKPAWITIDTATNAYPFSRTAIYDGMKTGRFRGKKDGTRTILEVESLDRAVEALPDFGS